MSGSGDPIRVLHVDDEPGFAEMAADMVEEVEGRLTVETATSGSEALDRLDDEVDCVVSDYQMPGIDGIELLEAVRDSHPDLPFVLFTAHGSESIASDAIAAGVTDYLQKGGGPEQYELLVNRVTNAVDQYRASQRAAALERVRKLVGRVNQALVHATTRREVERRACSIIADTDPYLLAWIGAYDAEEETVEPRASDGLDETYVDEISVTADETPTGAGPTGQALRAGEIAVAQNIPEDEAFEPWREAALDRGYRSSIAIPLRYGATTYGVLNVYAGREDAFDGREREMLGGLGTDIAEALHHRDVERQLRRERDRFHHFVDAIENYAIFTMDADGYVTTWNPGAEAIKGYTEAEIRGRHYRTFFPESAREEGRPEELLERAATTGVVDAEGWRVRADGSRFWADITLAGLYDGDGELRGYAKVTEDLTERREREQRLQRQNERLESFASVVSHDLRNPLNVAQGRIRMAQEGDDPENLAAAADAVDRALDLIDDLLTLARETDRTGDTEPVDLGDAFGRAFSNVATGPATSEVAADRTVVADRSQLRQLLANLVRNSVEHTDEDVTIRLGALDDGFYVADDGPGVPENRREQVFELGYTTAEEGTGLGLGIVRSIAEAHGWAVDLTDSEAGGARFEFRGVSVDD
ncbi:GAF domain-containing protein [Halorarius halobius]|uniref:GAF domain-containing protein n=1 Tax=Halorarius halobius TaxID=2962671 RepID=UPI0020CECA2D|nr:GAF domain-containing protein [Halorarius halobius]